MLISEHQTKTGKAGMVEKRFALSGASSVSDLQSETDDWFDFKVVSQIGDWWSPWEGETFLHHSGLSRLCLMFWNKFFPLLNLQYNASFFETYES